jgi:hypothetical protein
MMADSLDLPSWAEEYLMPLRRGQRVAAARSLGMGSVPAGTPGRVIKVGFFGSYDVNFGRGRVLHGLSRDALRLRGASWWALRRRR